MSTLNVSNITDGTTTVGTGYVVNGSAKAWCKFDGTGPTIGDSFNTTSITDVGIGDYTINLTTSLASNNGSHLFSSANFHAGRAAIGSADTIRGFVANSSHSLADSTFVVGTTHGDLA